MESMDSERILFTQAKRVLNLAEKLALAAGKAQYNMVDDEEFYRSGEAYKDIVKTFLNSAIEDSKAVILLLEARLFNGAFMELRRLFELLVDLLFIGKKPEGRSEQFLIYLFAQSKRIHGILTNSHPTYASLSDVKKQKESVDRLYKQAKRYLNSKRLPQWSRYKWDDKCNEVNLESGYKDIYSICS